MIRYYLSKLYAIMKILVECAFWMAISYPMIILPKTLFNKAAIYVLHRAELAINKIQVIENEIEWFDYKGEPRNDRK